MKRASPMIFVVAALVVAAVVAGAYLLLSDDDGTDDESLRREYVDAIASGWPADADQPGLFADLSDTEIGCVAEVQVEIAGVDWLAEHYTPDELRARIEADPNFDLDLGDGGGMTREQADQMVSGLDQCLSFLERLRGEARGAVEGDPAVTTEAVDCMTEALDDDFLREVTVDEFMLAPGADSATAVAQRVEDRCGELLPAD